MASLWFCYGFPMASRCFHYGFPLVVEVVVAADVAVAFAVAGTIRLTE